MGLHINIQGNVNQAAGKIINKDSHVGDIHHHGCDVSIDAILKAIKDAVPEDSQAETVAPLEAVAALPASEQQPEEIESIWQRLQGYAPAIVKCCAAFSEAALVALSTTNPWLCGLVALIRAVKPA